MSKYLTSEGYVEVYEMSDEELMMYINMSNEWDLELVCELMTRAGMYDEWENLPDEELDSAIIEAGETLGYRYTHFTFFPRTEPKEISLDNGLTYYSVSDLESGDPVITIAMYRMREEILANGYEKLMYKAMQLVDSGVNTYTGVHFLDIVRTYLALSAYDLIVG